GIATPAALISRRSARTSTRPERPRAAYVGPVRICLIGALALLAFAAPASALTPTITEFSSGLTTADNPFDVTPGPDGNLWFTDQGTTPAIGRIDPAGNIHEFDLSAGVSPAGIAAGPNGDLWFANAGATPSIDRITTSGVVEHFSGGLRP